MLNSAIILSLLLVNALAGVPRSEIDALRHWRVVGGSNAPDGAHPHQVSLQLYGSSHSCGGSIVDNDWVITAAHCVRGERPSDWKILAGTNKLNTGGTKYDVHEIHYHEKYNPNTGENDVAILKVGPIAYTDKVQPIAAETEDVGGDVNVTLSGWGRLSVGGTRPNDLQEIELKTTTVEFCQNSHSARPVFDSSVCTLTKAGEGACHGDSGGPLSRTVNDQRRLVGIVSWGQPCARGYPDVFGRVSSFIDWFNNICNCLN